jgi:hypothetical protein
MPKPTYIDGIGSSQALDTAGEIVELKGLDISSLVASSFNFEHESKLPSQIVGKILEARKIFSKEDCQNDRHHYYWDKCQLPFLYIMGRLFDDKKPSSVEVAALFKDDQEHPEEPDIIGFSVEGSKINKSGAVITHSIARKVTITAMPANKTCIAEMLPEKKVKVDPSDINELFKGEMELFAFEPTYVELMEKHDNMEQGGAADKGYNSAGAGSGVGGGNGGGAFIGSQLAMSEREDLEKALPEGWSGKITGNEAGFDHSKHGNVSVGKTRIGNFEVKHNGKLIGVSPNISHAGEHARKYMSVLGKNERLKKAGAFSTPEAVSVGTAAFGAPKPAATAPVPKPPSQSSASGGMFSPAFVQAAQTVKN